MQKEKTEMEMTIEELKEFVEKRGAGKNIFIDLGEYEKNDEQ